MTRTILRLQDVHARYGSIEVLKGINLEVNEGEIVTIIGANGAGKSTMLMTVSGIVCINQGSILFIDQPIHNQPPHEIVRMGIGQVPEGRKIFPNLTVLENLQMGAFTRCDRDNIQQDLERVFSLFPILNERKRQPGGTLSGGEQQMLSIGRALMSRPKLLLMDEPSLGLGPMFVKLIFDVIRELNQQGVTILLVEQNACMALKTAHRGYVMETGRIIMSNEAQKLLTDPRVKEAYLGE